jgi:hypothetical protein
MLAAAALVAAATGLAPAAQARTSVYLSVGVPGVYYAQPVPVFVQPAPLYVQPYPVLQVQPRPVYYVPAPVYVQPYGTYLRPLHRHGLTATTIAATEAGLSLPAAPPRRGRSLQ